MTLFSSSYQFGIKPLLQVTNSASNHILLLSSVAHCSLKQWNIMYMTRQPAYVLLLDASKAFDRVYYNELFTILIERNVSHLLFDFCCLCIQINPCV